MFTLAQSRIQSAVTSYKHCRMPVTWQAMYRISQVLPTPDCAGNFNLGTLWVAQSLSLVGTTLSPSPTLLQFDVEASSDCSVTARLHIKLEEGACCVPPGGIVQLLLEFNAVSSPSGRTLTAAGLSPDAIAFNLTGQFTPNFIALGVPMTIVTANVDAFAGARAAGLWTLNTSTDGATAVINSTFRNQQLRRAVEPCCTESQGQTSP